MTWTSGTPPCPGWYPASYEGNEDMERYWDGAHWSAPCYHDDPVHIRERAQRTRGEMQQCILYKLSATILAHPGLAWLLFTLFESLTRPISWV